MTKDILKVALIQQIGNIDKEISWQNTKAGIENAAQQGAELILLQELHATTYFCQNENLDAFKLAESVPGPTTIFLSQLARKHNVVIVGSVFERRASGLYHNTAVVFEKDGIIAGIYRKMHIPDDPGYYEKYYFTPGDLGFKPIDTSVGRLGILVCWDQWYPEAARLMALNGAEILLYPTAIGWAPDDAQQIKDTQLDKWIVIQRSHAIANCLPVMSCNRVGFEADSSDLIKGIQFWGNSFIANQSGTILAKAGHETEQVLVAEIDKKQTEITRQLWPYLRDRRIDAYNDLIKRFID